MALIPAWDKRTGRKLPEPVPASWIAKGTFAYLTDKEPTSAEVKAAKADAEKQATADKKEG